MRRPRRPRRNEKTTANRLPEAAHRKENKKSGRAQNNCAAQHKRAATRQGETTHGRPSGTASRQGKKKTKREHRRKHADNRGANHFGKKEKNRERERETEQHQDGIDDHHCRVRGVPGRSDQMLALCAERAAHRTVGIRFERWRTRRRRCSARKVAPPDALDHIERWLNRRLAADQDARPRHWPPRRGLRARNRQRHRRRLRRSSSSSSCQKRQATQQQGRRKRPPQRTARRPARD